MLQTLVTRKAATSAYNQTAEVFETMLGARIPKSGDWHALEDAGAQAVLHLRSVHLNGEMDQFTAYRIKLEKERLYGANSRFLAAP